MDHPDEPGDDGLGLSRMNRAMTLWVLVKEWIARMKLAMTDYWVEDLESSRVDIF